MRVSTILTVVRRRLQTKHHELPCAEYSVAPCFSASSPGSHRERPIALILAVYADAMPKTSLRIFRATVLSGVYCGSATTVKSYRAYFCNGLGPPPAEGVRARRHAATPGRDRAEPFFKFTRRGVQKAVEYSITVWRTPIGEFKEVLYCLTYRREWMPERNCWREIVVRQ